METLCENDAVFNPQLETGWQNVIWEQGTAACTLTNLDGDKDIYGNDVENDCVDDLPDQTFRKPYAGTSILGGSTGDSQAFWTLPGNTASFDWLWRKQDLPHDNSGSFDPDHGNPINMAKLRLRMRPKVTFNYNGGTYQYREALTRPFTLSVALKPTFFARLLPLAKEPWLFVDPAPYFDPPAAAVWLPEQDVTARVLRPLAEQRAGLEDFYWQVPGNDSATVGLMAASYSTETGLFDDLLPSEVISGAAVQTVRFAAASLGDYVYLYGGERDSGELSAKLWRGHVGQSPTTGQPAMLWEEVSMTSPPAARKDAVLVADAAQQRLVLLFGRTDSGDSDEAFAFDLASGSWSSLSWTAPVPRSNACAGTDGEHLYFYGGVDGGQELEGLYRLELATLDLQQVDSQTLPGPRQGCALSYDPFTKSLYLYGGDAGGQAHNDLWRFDLAEGQWQLVAAGPGDLASQAPTRASLTISRLDGTVRMLAGDHEAGQPQPAWSYDGDTWQSYQDLIGGQP